MKRIFFIPALSAVLLATQLSGCMSVSEHKHLMAAQQQRYDDLSSRFTQLQDEKRQLDSEHKRDSTDLQNCRTDQSRCTSASSALEEQLRVCNQLHTQPPLQVADCQVSDIHFDAPLKSEPPAWLRDFKIPGLKIRPPREQQDNGVVYRLDETQMRELDSATKDLIRTVQGWQIWYRDAVQQPADSVADRH